VHQVAGQAGVRQFRRSVDRPVELTGALPGSTRGRALENSDGMARGLEGGMARGKGMGMGVVDLQAGGWSFTARDMDGGVWVWGKLIGTCNTDEVLMTMMMIRPDGRDDRFQWTDLGRQTF